MFPGQNVKIIHNKQQIDPNSQVSKLENLVIEVKPLLLGGATKIAFINMHGAPNKLNN